MGKPKFKKGTYWRKDWTGKKRPSVSASVRKQIRLAYRNRCAICNSPAWKVDHIFPFFFGGRNVESNLTLLCKRCNKNKGARLNSTEMRKLAELGYVEAEKALRIAEWSQQDEEWINTNLPHKVRKKVLTIKHKHRWAVV